MMQGSETESKKPPMDALHRSEVVGLGDPIWIEAAFAIKQWVDIAVRQRARRHSALISWRDGKEEFKSEAITAIRQAMFEQLENANPSHITGTQASKSTRVQPSVKTGKLFYNGAVSPLTHRIAQRRESDLGREFRQALTLFVQPRINVYFWQSKDQLIENVTLRSLLMVDLGIDPGDLVEVLEEVIALEESPDGAEVFESYRDAIWEFMKKRAKDPSIPRHVRDAYAAARWNMGVEESEGGTLRIDDSKAVTTLRYGPKCKFVRCLDLAAKTIAAQYRWSEESGLLFLLTNQPQTVKTARIDYQIEADPTTLSRIVLTVDPTVTPEDVMALYSLARKQVVGRHQRISEVQMLLANHVYSQTHTCTSPEPIDSVKDEHEKYRDGWTDLMELWNSEQENSPWLGRKGDVRIYDDWWRFKASAEDAYRLLMNPKVCSPKESPEFPAFEYFMKPKRAGNARKTKVKTNERS